MPEDLRSLPKDVQRRKALFSGVCSYSLRNYTYASKRLIRNTSIFRIVPPLFSYITVEGLTDKRFQPFQFKKNLLGGVLHRRRHKKHTYIMPETKQSRMAMRLRNAIRQILVTVAPCNPSLQLKIINAIADNDESAKSYRRRILQGYTIERLIKAEAILPQVCKELAVQVTTEQAESINFGQWVRVKTDRREVSPFNGVVGRVVGIVGTKRDLVVIRVGKAAPYFYWNELELVGAPQDQEALV